MRRKLGEQSATTADGRNLAFRTIGDPDGAPIFLKHGMPGNKDSTPRAMVLHNMGIYLIAYDRPGYGGSDRHPGRTVADSATDVATIADKLQIKRPFGLCGRSGGAPFTLASAAILGKEQVAEAVVLVSPAPDSGDEWTEGMTEDNDKIYRGDLEDLEALLIARTIATQSNPRHVLEELESDLTPADKKVVHIPNMRRVIATSIAEGLRTGHYGWYDDMVAIRQPWGFNLADIAVPVKIWHGRQDGFAPVEHAVLLQKAIGDNATLTIQEDAAHFNAYEVIPSMLADLALRMNS